MSSSSYINSLSLLVLVLVLVRLQTAFVHGAYPLPLHYTCNAAGTLADEETFPPFGTYATNLESVFTKLYHRIEDENPSHGFFSSSESSVGGNVSESAYGQVLCRGDASAKLCQGCFSDATLAARNLCPFHRSVVVWYSSCSLKFSNINFYSKLDLRNNFTKANSQTLTDSDGFMNLTTSFLRELSAKAATNATTRFASGSRKLCSYLTLYAMAQCTEDISPRACSTCLNASIAALPQGSRQGARSHSANCNTRYEIYHFLDD